MFRCIDIKNSIRIIILKDIASYIRWANTIIRNTCRTNVPVVGRQQKNLKCLLDECASRWRTTEKLAIKGEFDNAAVLSLSFSLNQNLICCMEYGCEKSIHKE